MRRLSMLAVLTAATVLVACGTNTVSTTMTTGATTTTRAATTTSTRGTTTTTRSSATTSTTRSSTATAERIDMPTTLGEYSIITDERFTAQIDNLITTVEKDFERIGAGLYGTSSTPEYLLMVGSSAELESQSPEQVFRDFSTGVAGQGATIDESSKVSENIQGADVICATGTQGGNEFATCTIKEDEAFGVVYAIPGSGPSDVASAKAFAQLVIETE